MLELIMGWIVQNQTIDWVSSLILSMGVVGAFLSKYSPKIRKASKIAAKTLDVINSILDATDDKVITKLEVEAILAQVEKLQEVLK
jgi:hypothetical protein